MIKPGKQHLDEQGEAGGHEQYEHHLGPGENPEEVFHHGGLQVTHASVAGRDTVIGPAAVVV